MFLYIVKSLGIFWNLISESKDLIFNWASNVGNSFKAAISELKIIDLAEPSPANPQ